VIANATGIYLHMLWLRFLYNLDSAVIFLAGHEKKETFSTHIQGSVSITNCSKSRGLNKYEPSIDIILTLFIAVRYFVELRTLLLHYTPEC